MLILASNSPRRKELITEHITSDFLIVPSSYNESFDPTISIKENILNTAKNKGLEVFAKYPNDIVVSADTMVIFNNKVYGKPASKEDAKRMLLELSDNEHQVWTCYYVFKGNKVINHIEISYVKFKPLSLEFINRYIKGCNPLDKAGSYGIQDPLMNEQVEYYKGNLSNIIGLPIEALKKDLEGLI